MMMRKRAVAAFAVIIGALLVMSGLTGCGDKDDPYIPEQTYTIIFDSDGGSEVPSLTKKSGEAPGKPADPTRQGYEFLGWFFVYDWQGGGEFTEWDEPFYGSTNYPYTLKAKWLPVFDVTASNIAEKIKAMTETGKIIASGAFTEDDFTKEGGIRDALLELLDSENLQNSYDEPKILVTLDLSKVTELTKIPDNAFFEYSEALTDEDGNEITDINKYRKCINLAGIMLPSTIKSIGDHAFMSCTKLKSIELPVGVEKIGGQAFGSCFGLKSITLPSTLKEIDKYAFYWCLSLENMTLPAGLTKLGSNAFMLCGELKSISIPAGVKKIEDYAFYDCDKLETVKIADGVTAIGIYAFYRCRELKNIDIPDSVEKIDSSAFSSTYEDLSNSSHPRNMLLETVKIGIGVKEFGSSVFSNCINLKSVEFASGSELKEIASNAFENCEKLTSINIPNTVSAINSTAFKKCKALTSITIPASVTEIGAEAFLDSGLTSATFVDKDSLWYHDAGYGEDEQKKDDESIGKMDDPSENAKKLTITYKDEKIFQKESD